MISVMGVSHRAAALGTRERLHLGEADLPEVLRTAAERLGFALAVLSTCNRTEVYVASTAEGAVERAWEAITGASDVADAYVHRGTEAVRHLLDVACGLDSAILGDQQILGQVRAAKTVATEAGTLDKGLDQAFSLAIATARRSRKETEIGAGAPGIGASVSLALLRLDVEPHSPVAVLGAGMAAQGIAKHLVRAGFTDLRFLNRSPRGGAEMTERFGGTAVAWERLDTELASCDAVVAATGAARPVVTAPMLRQAADGRAARGTPPLVVVDAGMPRNVESCPDVSVLDLDDLGLHATEDAARRQAAVPAVRRIVDQEVAAWEQRRATDSVEQAIKALYVQSDVATKRLAREMVGDLTSVDEAERIVRRTLNAILHEHVGRLRELVSTEG